MRSSPPPAPPVDDVPLMQLLVPPNPPTVPPLVGKPAAVAVPGQFTFVPPAVPATPFPAVTVPRVNDSFADVVANTATLESPGLTPSGDVKPTS
jgi:hypothetical protein